MVLTPLARAASQIFFTGKICPVRLVMWQKCRTFVFGPIAEINRSARASSDGGGTGNEIFLMVIPSRRARWSHVVSIRP